MLNSLNDIYDSEILNIVASIMPESVIFVPRDYYNVKELQDFKASVDQKFANSKIEIEAKLDEKIDKSALGISVATLVGGKIPSDQLPSFVDDVLEYDTFDDLPEVGERGIIYVTLDNNSTYRWSGSTYISLANLSGYYTKTETESLISEAVAKVHLSFTANLDDASLTLDKLKAITIAFNLENATVYIRHNQIKYAIESIKQNAFTHVTTVTASAHLYDDTTNEYSIKLLRYIFDTDDVDDTIKVIPSVETKILIDTTGLTEYVKFTDYATENGNHGLVKISRVFGIGLPNGASMPIGIIQITDEDLAAQTNVYRPVTAAMLSKSVKAGVTKNKELLTDEEKTSACDWLGALKAETKTTALDQVYVKFKGGIQSFLNIADGLVGSSIVQRTADNRIRTNAPIDGNDCVNLQYLLNLPDKVTLTDEQKAKWRAMLGIE